MVIGISITEGVMKKVLKITVLAVFAGLLIMQLFQIDRSAPPIDPDETIDAAVTVPPEIREILSRSCSDCHSNATVYPWYANVQPAGWFLKNHIEEGRHELNFSIFNTYSEKKKSKKLEQMCEQAKAAEMPPPSYLFIHRAAVLDDRELQVLCDWAKRERPGNKETIQTDD
jgi:hypothetical protein